MTELQQLEIELNSITWKIDQADIGEDRQQVEQEHASRIQQILEEIETLKQNNI
jgi:hypothetical protein